MIAAAQSATEPMPAAPAVSAARPRDPLRKKSSLRSLFAAFRFPRTAAAEEEEEEEEELPGYLAKRGLRGRVKASFSTSSLPCAAQTSFAVVRGRGTQSPLVQSTASLPSQIQPPFAAAHTPSPSSSSSASSLEFPSDASTAATSPSSSVPSIAALSSPFPSEPSAKRHVPKAGLHAGHKLPSKPKRASDNFRKQSSPLSTVTDACAPHQLPTPPESPVLHERRNSFQPKRRNSLGRILLRRSQSNPDLAEPCGETPPVPPIPSSAPASRSTSASNSPSRSRTLRRKSMRPSEKPADLEKPTAYSKAEKIEHHSILGADPAGLGFYLYPKTEKELTIRRTSTAGYPNPMARQYAFGNTRNVENRRRNSWAPIPGEDDAFHSGVSVGGRAWREHRGRSFRSEINVLSQVIPEESGEASEHRATRRSYSERHSLVMDHTHWQQRGNCPDPVPAIPKSASSQMVLPSIDSRLDREEMNRDPTAISGSPARNDGSGDGALRPLLQATAASVATPHSQALPQPVRGDGQENKAPMRLPTAMVSGQETIGKLPSAETPMIKVDLITA